jgi:hypothetical protein
LAAYSVATRVIVFVGAGLLIFGSFLPWVKASVAGLSFEKNGLDGDGVFTLFLGVAAVLVFCLVRSTAGRVLTLLAGFLAAAVAFYDVVDINRMADEIASSAGALSIHASVGIGLWIAAVGSLVLIVGAMLAFGDAVRERS